MIDLSRAATIADMRGSRVAALSTVVQRFIRDFFDQNPLSHLSVCFMRDGTAQRLTDLSGSPVRPALPDLLIWALCAGSGFGMCIYLDLLQIHATVRKSMILCLVLLHVISCSCQLLPWACQHTIEAADLSMHMWG